MQKENFLTTILRWGIYAILFTPLIVSPKTIYPFLFGRVLSFQAIIGVLLGVWLILIYLYPKYRPQKTPIFIVLSLFFGILFISSLFGVDFNRSFWGHEERMGGLFTLAHFFILFLIARSVFMGWKDWKRVFCVSLFVSVLMCIIALGQREGYINLWGIAELSRAGGTIGNPIFFAGYLLFHIFFSFLLFIKTTDYRYRLLIAAASLINLFALFITETRGALVAFSFGLLLVFVGYAYLSKNKKIKILPIILLLVIGVSLLFIWLNKNSTWIIKIPVARRIAEISIADTTSRTRILTWLVSLDAWKEKPILGWGVEDFQIAFSKYYNPELLRYSIYETWFDHAHNTPLDYLVMTGLLGLLAYLSIFVVSLLMLYKFFHQKIIDEHILIIFIGLFAAYFAQNFFAFDSPSTLLLFFFCLAFIDSIKKYPQNEREERIKKFSPTLIIFVLLLSFAAVLFNFQIYKASAEHMKGAGTQGAPLEFKMDYYKSALNMFTPYKEEIRGDLLHDVLAEFINTEVPITNPEFYFKEAESAMLANIEEHPNHTFYYFILGRLYAEMGVYDSKYFKESEKMFKKSLELSPSRQQIYYGLGKLYLLQKQWDKAIEVLEKMVALDPKAADSYWFLGIAFFTAADIEDDESYLEKGYKEIRKAFDLGYAYKTKDDFVIFMNAFLKFKDYEPLIISYENDIELVKAGQPAGFLTADFCAKIAVIYQERGEKEKAREAALIAAELDPSFAEDAAMFIKMLGL